jgi:DNA-binding MarR family transcriptional regulator
VVSDALDDAELGRLLTQLLSLVNPAADDGTVGKGTAWEGAPGDALAPADAAPGKAAPADAAAADAAPGNAAPADRRADGGAADGALSVAVVPQLSGSEARALIELVKARGIAQGELAGLLGLEKSTVSRLAAGLERKGWIRRGRDEGNQRYVRLYLTAEGGAVAARLWRAWRSRQARLLSPPRSGLAWPLACVAWCAAWARRDCSGRPRRIRSTAGTRRRRRPGSRAGSRWRPGSGR